MLRNTRVDDGLHVLGQLPQGKSRADFIYALLRHDTGAATDLRRLICAAEKLDLDALLENAPQAEEQGTANNGRILQRIDGLGQALRKHCCS